MDLRLKRIARQTGYTIGRLYVVEPDDELPDGEKLTYLTDTLEPQWREAVRELSTMPFFLFSPTSMQPCVSAAVLRRHEAPHATTRQQKSR